MIVKICNAVSSYHENCPVAKGKKVERARAMMYVHVMLSPKQERATAPWRRHGTAGALGQKRKSACRVPGSLALTGQSLARCGPIRSDPASTRARDTFLYNTLSLGFYLRRRFHLRLHLHLLLQLSFHLSASLQAAAIFTSVLYLYPHCDLPYRPLSSL